MVVSTPEMGTWQGKTTELDERSFDESEVGRRRVAHLYQGGPRLKFLLAEYKQPSRGLYHNPMNCYHSQGFTLIGDVGW